MGLIDTELRALESMYTIMEKNGLGPIAIRKKGKDFMRKNIYIRVYKGTTNTLMGFDARLFGDARWSEIKKILVKWSAASDKEETDEEGVVWYYISMDTLKKLITKRAIERIKDTLKEIENTEDMKTVKEILKQMSRMNGKKIEELIQNVQKAGEWVDNQNILSLSTWREIETLVSLKDDKIVQTVVKSLI